MHDICNKFATDCGFKFNSLKSGCVLIGENVNPYSLPLMFIGGNVISWSGKLIYLGIDVCSEKLFICTLEKQRQKLCVSINQIISMGKRKSEEILLRVLKGAVHA